MASSTREVIMLSLTFLCLNPLLKSCVALALPTTSVNSNPPGKLFARGGPSIQATDPWDRRWIEQLTAVGDSYSVGLGAGHAVKAGSQVGVLKCTSPLMRRLRSNDG